MARKTNPKDVEPLSLFGMPLLISGKLSLADQIRDILLCQIQAGRWSIHERLPSISQLADHTGLSRQPFQQAFEALRAEGYLKQQRGNGTFLSSMLCQDDKPQGAIGVLMTNHPVEYPRTRAFFEADIWRLHAIIQEASRRRYIQEVHTAPQGDDAPFHEQFGSMFSAQVRGVISLRKFPLPEYDILPENVLPVVFLGYHLFPYGSCVALDLDAGFFRLTREVIQHGHRRIVLVPREFEPVGEMALIASGFERAMNEAGLPIDRQASEDAEGIASDAWQKARAFLQAHVDPKGPKGRQAATALVCAEYGQALCLIGVADLMGIRVPRDLSVVCMLSGPMRLQKPNQHVTGIEFDLDLMVRMGFEVLEEQIRTRRNSISQVRVKPVIERGDSLAPPRLASGE